MSIVYGIWGNFENTSFFKSKNEAILKVFCYLYSDLKVSRRNNNINDALANNNIDSLVNILKYRL